MKASKRARARRKSKGKTPAPAATPTETAFSELEESFFREGVALSEASTIDRVETFADLEARRPMPRPSLLRRLFSRQRVPVPG